VKLGWFINKNKPARVTNMRVLGIYGAQLLIRWGKHAIFLINKANYQKLKLQIHVTFQLFKYIVLSAASIIPPSLTDYPMVRV